MKFTTFAVVAATVLTAAPAAAVVNLVSNGSFELGANGLQGWTIGGVDNDTKRVGGFPPAAIFYNSATSYPTGAFGEAVPVNNAPTNSPDAAGARAAYFVSDFAVNQSLTQTISLNPGIYQIGFSVYAPGNGYDNVGEATFSGTIAGEVLANYAVSTRPGQQWRTFAGATEILTAGDYQIQFLFNTNFNTSKDIVIDQVYVIAGNPVVPEVPEPATWALLIAGFGMVGFASRRRRAIAA